MLKKFYQVRAHIIEKILIVLEGTKVRVKNRKHTGMKTLWKNNIVRMVKCTRIYKGGRSTEAEL